MRSFTIGARAAAVGLPSGAACCNELAALCFDRTAAACPTGQIAVAFASEGA